MRLVLVRAIRCARSMLNNVQVAIRITVHQLCLLAARKVDTIPAKKFCIAAVQTIAAHVLEVLIVVSVDRFVFEGRQD